MERNPKHRPSCRICPAPRPLNCLHACGCSQSHKHERERSGCSNGTHLCNARDGEGTAGGHGLEQDLCPAVRHDHAGTTRPVHAAAKHRGPAVRLLILAKCSLKAAANLRAIAQLKRCGHIARYSYKSDALQGGCCAVGFVVLQRRALRRLCASSKQPRWQSRGISAPETKLQAYAMALPALAGAK